MTGQDVLFDLSVSHYCDTDEDRLMFAIFERDLLYLSQFMLCRRPFNLLTNQDLIEKGLCLDVEFQTNSFTDFWRKRVS